MAQRGYTANIDVHAVSDGGFRSAFEIVDVSGAVVESETAGPIHKTAALAFSHARSRADAAIKVVIESVPVV
ncbi:hypothetical protein J2X57_001963 [Luteibacter sp. 1214]|uniref:hypothetical protein n=1 Tax=Luteibacter sp. 1214 TaxID=2817735 RepID=UPI00285BB901|nr:hypothetical protein [Luteibacter sp. 1214]MDR6642751.1 hypothetical protein [Luteibacter sp. 1214]